VETGNDSNRFFLTISGAVGEKPIEANTIYKVTRTENGQLPSGALTAILVIEKIDNETKTKIDEAMKQQAADLEAQKTKEQTEAKEKEAREVEAEAKQKKAIAEKREAAKWHTWTSADGQHTMYAKLVRFDGKVITMTKKDGTTLEVDKEKVSQADIDWMFAPNK
jgi:hypothetical protein